MHDAVVSIRSFYEEAFRSLDKKRRLPEVDIQFYPYVGINHTIRVRDGRVFVRIAELCRDMPASVHQALAFILVSKLLRKKVPPQARDSYSNYIKTPQIRERAAENKRKRGRKIVSGHRGEVYDLDKIFERLNHRYFGGRLAKPVLTWSARKTYRILGHHDATHQTVVVSKSLDSEQVPRYVLEFILYHEMLHIHHPTVHHNGRRYNHTPAFRRDEEKFEHFHEAERWIERNVRKLKRAAKKQ